MKYCIYCMEQLKDADNVCSLCGHTVTCDSIPAHHLIPGTVLNSKYLIGSAIGEGGFGITYIGRDLTLDMRVAVKEYYPNGYVNRAGTLSPDVSCTSTSEGYKDFFDKGKTRFLQEARILAKFSGLSGIVEVRDFFEANNTAYIVMEYLKGETLKEYLIKNGKLSPKYAVELLLPVMEALKKVHNQGLIHRDISPDNIMLVNGTAKLLDFGAARDVALVGNKSLSVMLKPGYAPEEQYRSKGIQGPWTDVYALCATLYKCITGVTPDDSAQRMYNDELQPPSSLGVRIEPSMEKALLKGLSVFQKDRFQSIDELLHDLKYESDCDKTVALFENIPSEDNGDISKSNSYVPERPLIYDNDATYLLPQETDRENTDHNSKKNNVQNNSYPIAIVISALILAIAAIVIVIILVSSNDNNGKDIVESQSSEEISSDTTANSEMSSEINDPNRPATISIAGEVYSTDMTGTLNLTGMKLHDEDINDLKYMTNITELILNDNQLTCPSVLGDLTNLERLIIRDNQITDISFVKDMTNLLVIDVSGNTITDISCLAGLENLTEIWVYNNNISDISALSSLKHLKYGSFSNNAISDFTPLVGNEFYDLYVQSNGLNGNFDAIKGLTVTHVFYVGGNGFDNLDDVYNYFNTDDDGAVVQN